MKARLFLLTLLVAATTSSVSAQVHFKNDSQFAVRVKVKGERSNALLGPFEIGPMKTGRIPIKPGLYRLVVERLDGTKKSQTLAWRDYSDRTVTYHVSLCVQCAAIGESADVVEVETVFIGEGPRIQYFTRGTYRLGASVVSDNNGVRVTDVEMNSPAYRLRRNDSRQIRWLHEGNSIITHVNGRPVQTSAEFEEALVRSPRNVSLMIFSKTRGNAIEHWTLLRE